MTEWLNKLEIAERFTHLKRRLVKLEIRWNTALIKSWLCWNFLQVKLCISWIFNKNWFRKFIWYSAYVSFM